MGDLGAGAGKITEPIAVLAAIAYNHAMLQSFDEKSDPSLGPPRVAALRALLTARGLAGYIVPRADEYQGEYVPKCSERLAWLTGFTGSAGTAVILAERAALFVDGRYTEQAREQTDAATFEIRQVPAERLTAWLTANAPRDARIGYDPRLFTLSMVEGLEKALGDAGIVLCAVEDNLIDSVWPDRPAAPVGQVSVHPLVFAGVAADQKLADLQAVLGKSGDDALLLTRPDSIAWLLNIRGADVPRTPFALSFAVVPAHGKIEWFIDDRKLSGLVRTELAGIAAVHAPNELDARLESLGRTKSKVRFDAGSASKWFAERLTAAGAILRREADPCQLAKAKKNLVELAGARAAHLRDGVAMVRLLSWLSREATTGGLDEIAVAQQLEELRQQTGQLKDLSFDTISAAGPHAALPHYRVNRTSNLPLEPNSVFLLDSGGQYLDGTTDITRTLAIGSPPQEARVRFTLVLKGMIAVSLARFPKGTRGCDLDPLARRALWAAGLDFDHGTGHGIGSYLSVHEGPQGISKSAMAELEAGMIISNEPGYYNPGAYGIRIENLVIVTEASQIAGGERPMHGFETLTLAPIDRTMVLVELLLPAERDWLNAYHARVRAELGPLLPEADRAWLESVAAPL